MNDLRIISADQIPIVQLAHHIDVVCAWEEFAYGVGLHRTPSVLMSCVLANPCRFLFAESGAGLETMLIGYADLWELKHEYFEALRISEAVEEAFVPANVVQPNDQKTGNFYVGSLIVAPHIVKWRKTKASLIFAKICSGLADQLDRVEFPSRILVVGSSKFGSRLAQRLGFKPIIPSTHSIDERPRFEKVLNSSRDVDAFRLRRHSLFKAGGSNAANKSQAA